MIILPTWNPQGLPDYINPNAYGSGDVYLLKTKQL